MILNESAIQRPLPAAVPDQAGPQPMPMKKRKSSALKGYGVLAALVAAGWLLREKNLITPEHGLGYWLGIVGGTAMLVLLLYPLRKRARFMHRFGATRHWFRLHMILGLVGPLLVLYHSNFQLGSFNSNVALFCMLSVSGSGIVGRHLYAAIHRGLYGRKTSLRELQSELREALESSQGLGQLMPELTKRLEQISSNLQGDQVRQTLGIRRSLRWTFTHMVTGLSLLWVARRELRARAATSAVVADNRKQLYRSAAQYIRRFMKLTGRVAQYSFYERLFGLWHMAHFPIFLMMVLSALVHVLAVHMY